MSELVDYRGHKAHPDFIKKVTKDRKITHFEFKDGKEYKRVPKAADGTECDCFA